MEVAGRLRADVAGEVVAAARTAFTSGSTVGALTAAGIAPVAAVLPQPSCSTSCSSPATSKDTASAEP
ncbi:hypothetical protein BJF90_35155 [Pseudonocardia sp. CNS-004]|nr:hypothetical protein BJF90_35155 [Pseudonocardia sp. CNS-004]